jgi:hypothetical protein
VILKLMQNRIICHYTMRKCMCWTVVEGTSLPEPCSFHWPQWHQSIAHQQFLCWIAFCSKHILHLYQLLSTYRKKRFYFLTSQGSIPSMAHKLFQTFLPVNRDALCIRIWSLHWILMYQALLLITYVCKQVCIFFSNRECKYVLVRFF